MITKKWKVVNYWGIWGPGKGGGGSVLSGGSGLSGSSSWGLPAFGSFVGPPPVRVLMVARMTIKMIDPIPAYLRRSFKGEVCGSGTRVSSGSSSFSGVGSGEGEAEAVASGSSSGGGRAITSGVGSVLT